MDTDYTKQSTRPRLNRIVLTIIGIGFAFALPIIFFVVGIFFYIKIPTVFIFFSFILTLAIGLLVPHLRYKYRGRVLIIWFIIMSFGLPLLARPYYMAIAAQEKLPTFSTQLVNVVYAPYEGFDVGGPHVIYSYRTTNQTQDYLKMKELYRTKFSNKQKWSAFEKSDKGQSYITFSKIGNLPPSITLVIDQKTPNLIEVGVDF